jgi:protein SCO1/2
MRGRFLLSFVVCFAVLAAVACRTATKLPIFPVGGDFALTGDDGRLFELSSLRGKAVLVFFGYTSCPDVCPTTLSKLSEVYKRLGRDSARVKTLYVTVDPDRDTPAVLKDVLSNFEVDALGLTGTRAQIDKVVAQYGAQYEIIPTPDSAAKYTVAHTATVYMLDRAGRTRAEFPYDATVDEIVSGLRAALSTSNS